MGIIPKGLTPSTAAFFLGFALIDGGALLLRLLHMWAWKYVLKDEIMDMLLAHKILPCEDAKRIREKLSTQETWRKAMAGGLLF